MNKYDLEMKCNAVIASCDTPKQLACAIRYICLAKKYINTCKLHKTLCDLNTSLTIDCPENRKIYRKYKGIYYD